MADGYGDWEDESLKRRQAEAAALRQRAMTTAGGGGMVGPIYVGRSPWATFAESLTGNVMEGSATRRQAELQALRQQEFKDWAGGMPSGEATPEQLQAHAVTGMGMRDPTARAAGGALFKSALDARARAAEQAREAAESARLFDYLKSANQGPVSLSGREEGVANAPEGGFTGDPAARRQEILALPDSPDKMAAMAQLDAQEAAAKRTRSLPASVAVAALGGKTASKVAPILATKENAEAMRNWRTGERENQQTFKSAENDKILEARQKMAATRAGAAMLPEYEDALEKAVAEGRLDPYKVNSRNRAYFGRMAKNNPTLNFNDMAGTAGADRATELEYSPKGISGRSMRSINTTMNHLDSLKKLGNALKNNDTRALNSVGNVFGVQFGNDAVTNFEAAKQMVAAEIIKSIVPGGGGVTERMHMAEQITAASSPEQLAGFIDTAKELMAGQLESLEQAYSRGDPERLTRLRTRLSPAAVEELSRKGVGAPNANRVNAIPTEMPAAPEEARQTIGDKSYVKRNGKWYEE